MVPIEFHRMEKKILWKSKRTSTFFVYLLSCSTEEIHLYRAEATCGWVNDDIIKNVGWTIPLIKFVFEWMNEWLMHLYSALLCIVVHPKCYTIMRGGLSWTTTSVQYPLGWCDGCFRTTAPVRSPHTSYRWRGERDIEPIKWMGIIRRPWLTRASGGNLARTLFIYLIYLKSLVSFIF